MEIINRPLHKLEPGTKEAVIQTLAVIRPLREYFFIDEQHESYASNEIDFENIFRREFIRYSESMFISEVEFKKMELEALEVNVKILESHFDFKVYKKVELSGLIKGNKSYLEKKPESKGTNTNLINIKDRSIVLGNFLMYLDTLQQNPFLPDVVKKNNSQLRYIRENLVEYPGRFEGASAKRVWDEYRIAKGLKISKTKFSRRRKQQLYDVRELLLNYNYTGEPLNACKLDYDKACLDHEMKFD